METQAAYRFFAQERVTVQEILAPHSECTFERARYQRVCEAQAERPETRWVYVADREGDSYKRIEVVFR